MSDKWNDLFPELSTQMTGGNALRSQFRKKAEAPVVPPVPAAPTVPQVPGLDDMGVEPVQPAPPSQVSVPLLRKTLKMPEAPVAPPAEAAPAEAAAPAQPAPAAPKPAPVAPPPNEGGPSYESRAREVAQTARNPANSTERVTFQGKYDPQGMGDGADDVFTGMDEAARGQPGVDLSSTGMKAPNIQGEWDENFTNYTKMSPGMKLEALKQLDMDQTFSEVLQRDEAGNPIGINLDNPASIQMALKAAADTGQHGMHRNLASLVYSQQHATQGQAWELIQNAQKGGLAKDPKVQAQLQTYGKQILTGSLLSQAAISGQDPAEKLKELAAGKLTGQQLQQAMKDPMMLKQIEQARAQGTPPMAAVMNMSTANKVALGLGIPLALFGAISMFTGDSSGMGMLAGLLGLLGIAQGSGAVDFLGMSGLSGMMGSNDSGGLMGSLAAPDEAQTVGWAQPPKPAAAPAAPAAPPQPLGSEQQNALAGMKAAPPDLKVLDGMGQFGKSVKDSLNDPQSKLRQEIQKAPELNDPRVALDPALQAPLKQKLIDGMKAEAGIWAGTVSEPEYAKAADLVAQQVLAERLPVWQGQQGKPAAPAPTAAPPPAAPAPPASTPYYLPDGKGGWVRGG